MKREWHQRNMACICLVKHEYIQNHCAACSSAYGGMITVVHHSVNNSNSALNITTNIHYTAFQHKCELTTTVMQDYVIDVSSQECALVPQETEGELFKRKSQWSEGYAKFMETWSRIINFFTLWKTSIQRVEGKHGKQLSSKAFMQHFFQAKQVHVPAL